jgi:glutaredoxin
MDKFVVLFTMKGCSHCQELKQMLDEQKLDYVERDIHEHEDEYQLFTEITENEYVPAFMVITDDQDNPSSKLFTPDRDFISLEEGVEIIKKEIL